MAQQLGLNMAAEKAAGAVGASLATELAPVKVNADLRIRVEWEASEAFFKYPIAVKVRGGKIEVVKPVHKEYDSTGLRGVWYYDPGDVDVLIYLYQNNVFPRHRWAYMKSCYLETGECHKIFYAASSVWQNGGNVDDVIMRLITLSNTTTKC